MNKLVLILLLLILITSCKISKRHYHESKLDQQKFYTFIHRFKVLDLPYSFDKLCILDSTINIKLVMDNDSIFIGFVGPCITIGLLPDTSKFYAVLYGIGATCYIPMLTVYRKDGTIISQVQLADGCGVGPGYECFDSVSIPSSTLIIHRKIEYMFEQEKTFEEAMGTAIKNIEIEKYSITKRGIISKN